MIFVNVHNVSGWVSYYKEYVKLKELLYDFYKNKPYISRNHQIQLLKQRGLKFKDENNAEYILSNIPYYKLVNGFKDHILDNNIEDYTGYYVEDLIKLHDFDREISLFTFKYILIFEESFETVLSHEISKYIGFIDDVYLNKNNYNLGRKTDSGLSEQDILFNNIDDIMNSNNTPILHYKNNYNNVPPWILIQHMHFGDKRYLYKLSKENIKNRVINHYFKNINGDNKYFFTYSLFIMNEYRNCAAHGDIISDSNFIKIPIKISKQPFIKGLNSNNYKFVHFNNNIGNEGLFILILCLNRLFRKRSTIKRNFQNELFKIVDDFKYNNTELFNKFSNHINFPYDYKKYLRDV